IVVERAGDFRPQIGADVKIGSEPTVGGLFEAQPMRSITINPVVDIGAEAEQQSAVSIVELLHLDSEKRRVVDADADLLDRSDQEMLVAFALEYRGEKAH